MRLEDILRSVDIESQDRQFVVTDDAGKHYMVKILEVFDTDVYKYLLTHRHPNIPILFAFTIRDGKMVIAEDYIESTTLREYAAKESRPIEIYLEILCRICDAVQFLHKATPMIIHRDIKPDNILVDSYGRVFLTDYDAAKIYHAGFKRDTVLIGTAGSAAPEQYGFAQSDQRTDIYGIGKLMEFLIPEESRPSWAAKIIRKATAIDPQSRFENVEELKKSILERRVATGLFPLPGFREKDPLKMLGAIPGYFILAVLYLSTMKAAVDPSSYAKYDGVLSDTKGFSAIGFIFFIAVFAAANLLFLMIYDMFAKWLGLYTWLPFLNKKWPIRQMAALVYAVLMYFLIVYLSSIGVAALVGLNIVACIRLIDREVRKIKLEKKMRKRKTEEDK